MLEQIKSFIWRLENETDQVRMEPWRDSGFHLNATAVSEGGDGAVLGEALQLSLALHGHARGDVGVPAAEPGQVAMLRAALVGGHADALSDGAHPLALGLAQPFLGPPPPPRGALACTGDRPLPGDPPNQSALRRPRAPSSAASPFSGVKKGGVEHGDCVEARERDELGLAVAAVEVERGENHLLARLAAPRGPLGDDPGRRGGRGLGAGAGPGLGADVVVHGEGEARRVRRRAQHASAVASLSGREGK
jgi:hypothetical protein